MDRLEHIGMEILNTTWLEWLAVFTSLAYVILIARKELSGWYFAAISSTCYIYICFINQLYLESILQTYYLVMAGWGWYMWRKTAFSNNFITRWSLSHHALFVLSNGAVALLAGFLFDVYTDQALPYADALVTVFSLGTTFMVTKRVLENWLYWIVIDSISVYLYFSRDLNMTSILFALYTVISVVGYLRWWREYRNQQA